MSLPKGKTKLVRSESSATKMLPSLPVLGIPEWAEKRYPFLHDALQEQQAFNKSILSYLQSAKESPPTPTEG